MSRIGIGAPAYTPDEGTLEWAKSQALKGARVRRAWWDAGRFITFRDGVFVGESGNVYENGWPFTDDSDKTWSLFGPAPTSKPVWSEWSRSEGAARLEDFMTGETRMEVTRTKRGYKVRYQRGTAVT